MSAAQQRAGAARAAACAAFAALNPSNPSSLPASMFSALMLTLGMQYSEQEASILSAALSEVPLARFVAWYETRLASLAAAGRPLDSAGASASGAAPSEAASVDGGGSPAEATEHAAPTAVIGSNAVPSQQASDAAASVDAASASTSSVGAAASGADTANHNTTASTGSATFQLTLQLSAPGSLDPSATAATRREQRGLLAAAWLAAYDELLRIPLDFLAQREETGAACEELQVLKHDVQMYHPAGPQVLALRVLSADHLQACMAVTAERVHRLKVRYCSCVCIVRALYRVT
jgi:hypothetical protein